MDTNLEVKVKTNNQHKWLERESFGVDFVALSNYIKTLLEKVKAPITSYTFFVHGKLQGIEPKIFSVKMLNSKLLHFSFYKAGDIVPVYGSFSTKGLSAEEIKNLFSCLKTWENGEGKIFSTPKENTLHNFMIARTAEIEREAESLLDMSLTNAFTSLLNAKAGSAKGDLYKLLTQKIIDFTKKHKKNLGSKDIVIFSSKEVIILDDKPQNTPNFSNVYFSQLLQKLVEKFVYKHNDKIKVFFAKLFLDFYKSPNTFDLKVLANKKTLWEVKMLETIALANVPNQGKRKFVWNVQKEKDFKVICNQYTLNEERVNGLRKLFFVEGYEKLIEAYKRQLAEGLESAESLKKDLAEARANYDSEQAAIISLQRQIEERKKKVGTLRADILLKEQSIGKLVEMSF